MILLQKDTSFKLTGVGTSHIMCNEGNWFPFLLRLFCLRCVLSENLGSSSQDYQPYPYFLLSPDSQSFNYCTCDNCAVLHRAVVIGRTSS